ncbi:MAG TPA: hypothetical protein DD990_33355, partial [Cyanobacteria bacterium UBA11368]|nr:hypothetical protein [Cyanobacteria bacterium UBA11368]
SLSESWTFFWTTARKFQLIFSIYFVQIAEARKVAIKQTNPHNPVFVNPQRFYKCQLSSDRVIY